MRYLEDKRAQIGLDIVKAVMLIFLVIAVIGVAMILTLVSLRDTDAAKTTVTGTTLNESTLIAMNESTTVVLTHYASYLYYEPTCTILLAQNRTSGATITSGNYTSSSGGCGLTYIEEAGTYNNSIWNISYSWSYKENYAARSIAGNVTGGVTTFFSNTGTVFAILVVIVIILAIALIIVSINRFQGGRSIL